jgi:hypothetical protein
MTVRKTWQKIKIGADLLKWVYQQSTTFPFLAGVQLIVASISLAFAMGWGLTTALALAHSLFQEILQLLCHISF